MTAHDSRHHQHKSRPLRIRTYVIEILSDLGFEQYDYITFALRENEVPVYPEDMLNPHVSEKKKRDTLQYIRTHVDAHKPSLGTIKHIRVCSRAAHDRIAVPGPEPLIEVTLASCALFDIDQDGNAAPSLKD